MADETPAPSGPDSTAPVAPSAADDLATWTTPPPETLASAAPSGRGLSSKAKLAGIVGTAVVVGFVGVLVMQGGSSAATNDARGGFGGRPGAGGQGFPGAQTGQQGFRGGFADRGVAGTVTAVSSSSITVAGTTVKVTSATQVVANGAQSLLSAVKKGDTVFVHTEGTGADRFAERIFVGGLPQGGPGAGGQGGPGFGPPPDQDGSGNGSTSHT